MCWYISVGIACIIIPKHNNVFCVDIDDNCLECGLEKLVDVFRRHILKK